MVEAREIAKSAVNDSISNDNGRARRMGLRLGVFIASMLVLAFGSAFGFLMMEEAQERARMRAVVEQDAYYEGISVAGVDISGMLRKEAEAAVEEAIAVRLADRKITVGIGESEWVFSLPCTARTRVVLDEAYDVARTGSIEDRYAQIVELGRTGQDFPVEIQNDITGLDAFLNIIQAEIDAPPVNATLTAFDSEKRMFTYTDEQMGRSLDIASLKAEINAALHAGDYPVHVEAKVDEIAPAVKKDDLAGNIGLLSSFETTAKNDSNRNENIRLACASFDGRVLMPGEMFSFNESTGQRTTEKGYRSAGAIRNGKDVEEIGGGVCQVSTTLFNAAVRAGLTIVERNNHSYPIGYVPRGADAMVDYPGRDLQLRNDGEGPVYFTSHFENNTLTVEVHGAPILEEGVTVELNPVTTATISMPSRVTRYDSDKENGSRTVERKGRTGYRVTTYIQYMKDGAVVREEELFKSNYSAIAELVIYGTRL